MKQRFSSLDVKVIASELAAALLTLRVSNIYDLSSRIFLLKFAKPGHRQQLLVDSGFRCHLTSFSRTAATAPSAFVSRLRKYLKSRRVTGVAQVGTDRIIEISFSDGQYRLFLEFFAAGNIIVTDADLNVLALQRQVSEGDDDVDVKLGGKYVLDAKQNVHGIPPITPERVRATLEQAVQRLRQANEVGGKKAKRAKGADNLGKALSGGFSEFPPHLLDHVFHETGVRADMKAGDVLDEAPSFDLVMTALKRAADILRSLEAEHSKGYIIAKVKDAADVPDGDAAPRESLMYDDFHPFNPSQFAGKPGIHVLEWDGFNRTVDEFYSSLESQKLESRLTEKEEAARKKLQTARDEHQKRIGALQQVQELHVRKAQAIEANTHRVAEAIAAVNGLIGQGMDWVDMGKLIENEKTRDNVVAQMIKLPLKLEENTVTLLLDEPGVAEDDSDEDMQSDDESGSDLTADKPSARADGRLAIDIDLAFTAWANARQYYDQKKTAAVKEQKTMESSAKALQSAEKKIEADLKKGLKQEKPALRPTRKQFWFEKFLHFISSDGYLVIGGKDAQQNELLYRRYLKKGDIYVHADLHGAASVVVKNDPRTPDAPIPPSTLSQAGALTVCTSSAWDSKALMGAWWVAADQVSKTAPNGEYLTTGGFIIRGKKNLLPPSQLLLGFSVMWLISEESKANHGKYRLERTESMLSGEAEALPADAIGLSVEEQVDFEEEAPDLQEEPTPGIEDVAEEEQKHLENDGDDDNDNYDNDSVVGSDADTRSNPLQVVPQPTDELRSNPLQAIPRSTDDVELTKDREDDSQAGSGTKSDIEDEPHDAPDTDPTSRPSTPASTSFIAPPKSKQQPLPRGKRAKVKRAQKKYADQDDEDRALAMELLGSSRGQDRKQVAEADRAAREAKAEADRGRRKAQHAKAAEHERLRHQRLEKAAAAGGDDGTELDELAEQTKEQLEQERRELMDIDRLVPYPQPGDELLAAIPMVAPWTAMTRQKYKIKLQPGAMKKGKAVREIVSFWTSLPAKGPRVVDETNMDKERVWRREMDLLKEWRVEEIVGSVPVKGCRIVHGGGLGGGLGGGGGGGKNTGGAVGGKGKGKGSGGKKGR